MRLQTLPLLAGRFWIQKLLRHMNHMLTGADFVPGCQIGPGLLMEHPSGVVIGKGSVIGSNCTLLQQVTLGERLGKGDGRSQYPVLGDGAFIGAGAKVLGPVTIGRGSIVGANSVVLVDVPDGRVAVGIPAKIR